MPQATLVEGISSYIWSGPGAVQPPQARSIYMSLSPQQAWLLYYLDGRTPGVICARAEHKGECTAVLDLTPGQPGVAPGPLIDVQALDIGSVVRGALAADGEQRAISQVQLRQGKERAAQRESTNAGNLRVKTQSGEDIPGGHRPAVVIARQATGSGAIQLLLDVSDNLLDTVWPANKIVDPRDAKTRLITHESIETTRTVIQLLKKLIQARDC